MQDSLPITLLIGTTVVVGIGAQVLARLLRLPSIILLLLFGILLGSSGLGAIDPTILGSGFEAIVSLAIALILFEGGLNLQTRDLGSVSVSLRNLVTIGVFVTLCGGAIAAHVSSHFPWTTAWLYASLVIVTGPTVVTPLLKLIAAERRTATLLEGEGILIDPVGAIVAVIVLNITIGLNEVPLVLVGSAIPVLILKGLGLRLGVGVAIGSIAGLLLSLLLKQFKSLPQELKNLVVLAAVWGTFSLAQTLRSESGLLAVVLMGMILRAADIPELRSIRHFNEQLGILANSVLFILLAANISLASLLALGWESVVTVLALMFVVRPLNIIISTWNRGFSWQQLFLLSWIAPRGIVAASMASLFAIALAQKEIEGGEAINALVFLTILMTVFIQGLTAGWVTQWLGLRTNQIEIAIVGDNPLSHLLTQLLQQHGQAVFLIDLSTAADSMPIEEVEAIATSIDLEELEAEGITTLTTFVALTSHPELNGVLAQQAMELFHPNTVALLSQSSAHVIDRPDIAATGIKVAFVPQVDLQRWNQSLAAKDALLTEISLDGGEFAAQQTELQSGIATGKLLPLLLERSGCYQIAIADEVWQIGDRLFYLLDKSGSITASSDRRSAITIGVAESTAERVVGQIENSA